MAVVIERLVVELDRPARLAVYELLEAVVGERVADSDNDAPVASHLLDADQDEAVSTTPRVYESKDVFENLGLLVVGGFRKRVLVSLEVEQNGLVFVNQRFELGGNSRG